MKNVRKIILYLASAIGVWLLASFAGAMFDSVNAAFWSDSLMWSILSFLIVMPALALMNDLSFRTQQADSAAQQGTASTEVMDSNAPSFIDENSDQSQTLWPEPEQSEYSDWPPQESREQQDRVRA
jgi:hypothetical protein